MEVMLIGIIVLLAYHRANGFWLLLLATTKHQVHQEQCAIRSNHPLKQKNTQEEEIPVMSGS
jgi:succinate dehydrogenase/fumarate reductase cytochrome b subunit